MKKRVFQVLGAVSIVAGGIVAVAFIGGLFSGRVRGIWGIGDEILAGAFSLYLAQLGIRGLNYGKAFTHQPSRFGWGKMLLGSLLIWVNLHNYFDPAPNLLKPANEGEAAGMNAAIVILCIVGLFLIVKGVRAGFAEHRVAIQNSAVGAKLANPTDHSSN